MKKKIILIAMLAFFAGSQMFAQSSQGNTQVTNIKTAVSVYYFHFNARCATCRAVESVTKNGIKELFGDKVAFAAYNLDEKSGELRGKELDISGQTLLIVKGDKIINLTNEGFMYARTNPEKFKQILNANIQPLL